MMPLVMLKSIMVSLLLVIVLNLSLLRTLGLALGVRVDTSDSPENMTPKELADALQWPVIQSLD